MAPIHLREQVRADGHFIVFILLQKQLGFLIEIFPANVQHGKNQICQIVGFFQPYSGLVLLHIFRYLQLVFDCLHMCNDGRSFAFRCWGLSVYGHLPLPFVGHLKGD